MGLASPSHNPGPPGHVGVSGPRLGTGNTAGAPGADLLPPLSEALATAAQRLLQIQFLNDCYRLGGMNIHLPPGLDNLSEPIDDLAARLFPDSHRAFVAASGGLISALPVVFDPGLSVGPFLAVRDRDPTGQPYYFLDLGAQIASHPFGHNDPDIVAAVMPAISEMADRFALSEYQAIQSVAFTEQISKIAPPGTPRFFIVNTGAEVVENGMKAVLLQRMLESDGRETPVIISFDNAFHGRSIACLAVTQRKKAKSGFPTFDWPHVPFPLLDPGSDLRTDGRERQALLRVFKLLETGATRGMACDEAKFEPVLAAIDRFLCSSERDSSAFVSEQRQAVGQESVTRARRVAGVLIEPIQGEGGIRLTSARFMQRLRMLTAIYDVPLMFDEIQTGWGATGTLWAHEAFELPIPPDAVFWGKKAQMGVLFVSEALATFFQLEKKFNTTWGGESAGMIRVLACLKKFDLGQIHQTGEYAYRGLEQLRNEFRDIVKDVRGKGVMLGFDVARSDIRDTLREICLRQGLILLPAGERTLRFYPRYDMERYAMDMAFQILRSSLEAIRQGATISPPHRGTLRQLGPLEHPITTIEVREITKENFASIREELEFLEGECYPDSNPSLKRLRLPIEGLEKTMDERGAIGMVLHDKVSGRCLGYALGSPLEGHDEEGVHEDPGFGQENTFYLHAMAVLPSALNRSELEDFLVRGIHERAGKSGFQFISTLIEREVFERVSIWRDRGEVLRTFPDYLGHPFVYFRLALGECSATHGGQHA